MTAGRNALCCHATVYVAQKLPEGRSAAGNANTPTWSGARAFARWQVLYPHLRAYCSLSQTAELDIEKLRKEHKMGAKGDGLKDCDVPLVDALLHSRLLSLG